MILRVRRLGISVIAVLFGLFQGALGLGSFGFYSNPTGPSIAIGVYLLTLLSSVAFYRGVQLPAWHAALATAAACSLPLLTNPAITNRVFDTYATWYIGGVGVILTVLVVRQRYTFAWIGSAVVTIEVVTWAQNFNVIWQSGLLGGMLLLVAAGQAISLGVESSAKTAKFLADKAAKEKSESQAVSARRAERQVRLQSTFVAARDLLELIANSEGALSPEQKSQAALAEASLRDEIRGRDLITPALRDAVREARLRGVEVILLDEGGLDGEDPELVTRMLGDVAASVEGVQRGRITIRTVKGEAWLITVLVTDSPNDPPVLWLRLP